MREVFGRLANQAAQWGPLIVPAGAGGTMTAYFLSGADWIRGSSPLVWWSAVLGVSAFTAFVCWLFARIFGVAVAGYVDQDSLRAKWQRRRFRQYRVFCHTYLDPTIEHAQRALGMCVGELMKSGDDVRTALAHASQWGTEPFGNARTSLNNALIGVEIVSRREMIGRLHMVYYRYLHIRSWTLRLARAAGKDLAADPIVLFETWKRLEHNLLQELPRFSLIDEDLSQSIRGQGQIEPLNDAMVRLP